MIPVHPPILAFLNRERRDTLLREAEDRRLVLMSDISRTESSWRRFMTLMRGVRGAGRSGPEDRRQPEPKPVESDDDGGGAAAA